MFVPPKQPRLSAEREEARRLRAAGMPIRRIADTLKVSRSSVSVWTRDIEIPPAIQAENLSNASRRRGSSCRDFHRARRARFQETGRDQARVGCPLHAIGCMLYWAEGAKDRNVAIFANSDPAMMETFMRFLRECFGLKSDDVTFRLNVYTGNGLSLEEIELFWMYRLGLSRRCARKHTLNHFPTSSSGKRMNKLPYGVCTLRVKESTWLVQHIYGAIQEYSGINQPDWLDGPARKPRPSTT